MIVAEVVINLQLSAMIITQSVVNIGDFENYPPS